MGSVHYDSALFEAAHGRFLDDAKSLTDDDLAQFNVVDPKFAERARAKRAGFVKARTPEEQAAAKLPVTLEMFLESLDDFYGPVLATYRHKLHESRDLIVALESRITALERKPHVKFCGVHEAGRSYEPGDAVTHGGGLWICRVETTGKPNQDFVGWTLAVKSRSIT